LEFYNKSSLTKLLDILNEVLEWKRKKSK
jgi:hypothetical protein